MTASGKGVGPNSPVTVALFLLTVAGFGTVFSLNSVAVASIPPLWVATIRAAVACVLLLLVIAATGRRIPVAARDLRTFALIGATTGAFPFFLLAWGQSIVASSLAGVLFASVPRITVFLSWAVFAGSRPTASRISGAVLGLLGVAIAFPGVFSTTLAETLGAAAILIAALSYALGGLVLQRARGYDPFALMAGQFLFVTLALLGAAGMFADPPPPIALEPPYIAAFVLGATGSALPLLCFLLLLRRTDPVAASSITFFVPFVAISVGVTLLNEPATASLLVGFAICALGSALVLRPLPNQSTLNTETPNDT